jgi:peroxiredoxin family protein
VGAGCVPWTVLAADPAERARRKKAAEAEASKGAEMAEYLAKMQKMEAVDKIEQEITELREKARENHRVLACPALAEGAGWGGGAAAPEAAT